MKRKRLVLPLLALLAFTSTDGMAQRIQQPLGRGVVAVRNGNNVFISWRKLAQEPEDISYNVYMRSIGSESYTKVNDQPLKTTNLSTTIGKVPTGKEIAVAAVVNDTETSRQRPVCIYRTFVEKCVYGHHL